LQTLDNERKSFPSLFGVNGILLVNNNEKPLVCEADPVQDAIFFFRKRALVARYQNEGIRLGQKALGSLRILGNRRS
jgi:hypothetical protein